MNQETNAGTQEVQQEKTAQNKRSKNTGKNRPVLVTSSSEDATRDESAEAASETVQPVEEVVTPAKAEDTQPRRFPKFFSSVGKSAKNDTSEADQASARIARATRNSATTSVNSTAAKESKPAKSQTSTNKVAPKPAPKAQPR
ncbi:MAG: hypothetical protein ACXVBU_14995, partial [Ktedonobacteraceae bacterium]